MSRFGLDYAWATIAPAAHRAVGSSFAVRYLSPDSSKNLTPAEARTLRAGGVDVVVAWESAAGRALAGRGAGAADAHAALGQARACGMPAGRPIYFSCDFDETPDQAAAVADYFRGVHDVLDSPGPADFPGERVPVGAYGGYWAIKRLFDADLIQYGWQTYAWSGGRLESRAQLYQYSNSHIVAGQSCDYDHALKADFGQWGYKPPPPPHPHATGEAVLLLKWNADQRAWTLHPQKGSFRPGTQHRRATLKVAIDESSGHWSDKPLDWDA